MKLSPKQIHLLNVLSTEWTDVMETVNIHLNTVYALYDKGLIDIKWIGIVPERKMMIRKINND
jgi:hypothetical protein